MAVHTMPVSEVRKALNALLGERNKPIIITQHGHARGVLIDIETYNSLVDELEDARDDRDAELARAVAEARAAGSRRELVPLADVLREHGL
jgi:prevent-host-death family protein